MVRGPRGAGSPKGVRHPPGTGRAKAGYEAAMAAPLHGDDIARAEAMRTVHRTKTAIRSVLGFHLQLDNVSLGAMTLYSERINFFTPELRTAAAIYADHAAIALARAMNHDEAANLNVALSSSTPADPIRQASAR